MFGSEPSPIYVFGTGVDMAPSSTLQRVRRHFTGSCDLTPALDDPFLSRSFGRPLDVYSWRHRSEEEAKANVPRQLKKTTFDPETIRSPVSRTWSTYYGPGHAIVLAALDLTKPPFERTGGDQLAGALCRALHRALAPDPQMQRQLRLKVDRDRGAWIRPDTNSGTASPSPSPSPSSSPESLIGDTAVAINEDLLATLAMTLNVEGPVTGPEPHLNPWARLASVPGIPAHRRRHPAGAATSLARTLGYADHALGDGGTVLSHRAVQWFTRQMMASLARELGLPPPRFVEAEEVFPGDEVGIGDIIPIPIPGGGGGGSDFGGFEIGGFDIF
ncbi:hypothetical protein PG993_014047 [Apiospora rasikravindrae]|uniref:Uncharacterized protein n=1 Tax=Apiospora rasikravindrae TaxID=990691 RepID=A0ABR1RT26_9PEZI